MSYATKGLRLNPDVLWKSPRVQINHWMRKMIYNYYQELSGIEGIPLNRKDGSTKRERRMWMMGYECLTKIKNIMVLAKPIKKKGKK